MRQTLTVDDEPHLLIRSLSVNYGAGGSERIHTHVWPQFLYARTGVIQAEIEDTIWIVPPRRGLWIPVGKPHRLIMLGVVELRTLYCRQDIAVGKDDVRVFGVCGLLHEAVLRVCDLQWLDERDHKHKRLSALIIDEVTAATSDAIRLTMPIDPRARRLAQCFMDAGPDYAELAALYSAVGLSRRTGERLFRKETGLSPARWYRLARLSQGLAYLTKNGDIERAAEVAGYRSRGAFSDVFTKTFGFPPSAAK